MARLAILTDRLHQDTDWKGAIIWRIVLALAESQHEVLVITDQALEHIPLTHSRLTVTRPVVSWRVSQLPKLTQVLLSYRPQILHTFALRPDRRWPRLTVWPYLDSLCRAVPGLQRISTVFESTDCASGEASFGWHRGGHLLTVFTEAQRNHFSNATKLPLDLDSDLVSAGKVASTNRVLVPAPVSEWRDPEAELERLLEFLAIEPSCTVEIIGGWGTWPLSQRRRGWDRLGEHALRIRLLPSLSLAELTREMESADSLWMEPLNVESWRYVLAVELATQLGKKLIRGEASEAAMVERGSTANSLSRLYLAPRAEW